MKRTTLILLLLLTSLLVYSQQDPDKYIYEKERLRVIKDTLTLEGTVKLVFSELDGDYHIRLKIDSGTIKLSRKNYTLQDSCIVLEIVCGHKAIFPISCTCGDYQNQIQIPLVGEHIKVTGRLVFDKRHRWTELHSVYNIQVTPAEVATK